MSGFRATGLIGLLLLYPAVSHAQAEPGAAGRYGDTVNRYCVGCHNDTLKTAGLSRVSGAQNGARFHRTSRVPLQSTMQLGSSGKSEQKLGPPEQLVVLDQAPDRGLFGAGGVDGGVATPVDRHAAPLPTPAPLLVLFKALECGAGDHRLLKSTQELGLVGLDLNQIVIAAIDDRLDGFFRQCSASSVKTTPLRPRASTSVSIRVRVTTTSLVALLW